MADQSAIENVQFRIRRDASGAAAWVRTAWSERKWFRWGIIAGVVGFVLMLLFWIFLAWNLPDAKRLLDYEPPLPTMVRGIDGEIVDSYARERRVQLRFVDFPEQLTEAYLAAEDKTFWSHGGVDFTGLVGAVIDYVSKIGSGDRAKGGSTITQQVAKNILVGDEYSVTRKLKEMILASRIEGVLEKEQILELYLNEIPLGRRTYGVQAASRAYFDKDVGDLELHEMAYLAILPKAPETYSRTKNFDQALVRRNIVLGQMAENEFITPAEATAAKALPLGIVEMKSRRRSADAGYFLEEVRRQLIKDFGETADDGPHSVYAGGLWVRTSLDVELQDEARDALRAGIMRYQGNRAWKAPIATIDLDEGSWAGQLQSSYLGISYKDWRVGVVTERAGSSAKIGFADGEEFPLANLPNALKAGDVIAASPQGSGYRVRTVPEVSGGFLAQNPQNGRVLAMQGGFDARLGSFNRATQAMRQPGSTIKPFVYATGLDHGMTPSTIIPDRRYCYYQGSRLGQKCFSNFGGGRGGGEYPMRYGLEQSKNLMTVHIAMDAGMPNVVQAIEKVGIGSYNPYPAFALGAGDTTVQKMVTAYSALANHGRLPQSTVIDFVQDRSGKVIWRADKRKCSSCNMPEWDGKAMPRLKSQGVQAMDARTAFQTVHMLEGVVQRGTAVTLRDLGIPLFGKTGTTTGPTNVWFVGGSPDIVAGVYLGFDTPRNMGGYAQGGTLAAPIFKQFARNSKDKFSGDPFVAPKGVRMVRVSRKTGKRVFDGWPGTDPKAAVIWEAFKPDTEPPRTTRQDEIAAKRDEILALIKRGRQGATRRPAAEPSPAAEPEETSEAPSGD
ncbi:transglycosylase domain-containing protein [Altererythrobacter sp. ZODW24]|uniref:penicillin-binding protein 1A n=1 Tax=Altererythrobacter sp. ZODW24 TaxID=2185142 RepID=UPI000DF7EFE3|nr:transglycosylase domain-containing protein [Altererythrobacter sp. ZODW24]